MMWLGFGITTVCAYLMGYSKAITEVYNRRAKTKRELDQLFKEENVCLEYQK